MRKFFTHCDRIVPVHQPRVLIETALAQGASRAALFERSELNEEMLATPETRISYADYGRLVANALRATRNPALGLDVGRNTGIAQMGVFGLALMSSPTLGAMMAALARHIRGVAPAWQLELSLHGGRASARFIEAIPLDPFRTFAHEVLLTACITQIEALIGKPLAVRSVKLSFSKPMYASRYAEVYAGPIEYDCESTEAEFDVAVLGERLPFADPATAKLAEQYVAQLEVPSSSLDGLILQLRRLLQTTRGRPPNIEEVAQRLQTSSRSLRRALHGMGLSYSELVDDARRQRALEWVSSTALTCEEMSQRLGFSNVRSFRRAFRRWTGQSPTERRALGAARDANPRVASEADTTASSPPR